MAFQDLREYLEALEKEGQLIRFTEEVWPEPDIREISRIIGDLATDCPAVLVENIKGYQGKKVAVNLHGGRANLAIMLGLEKTTPWKEQFRELAKRWDNFEDGEIQWYNGNPPCQEVIVTKDINLYHTLPLYRINPCDGGFYLAKTCVVTHDLEEPYNFEKVNVGTYRVQVLGPDTLALQSFAYHHISVHACKAEILNKALPISICLGVDPILMYIANAPVAYDQSEYKYASALSGTAEILTRGNTNDLPIPIGAEFVIEGEIIPRRRVPGGPFGEFPGCYSALSGQYQIKVKAVTHRENPIFENIYFGKSGAEVDTFQGMTTGISIYKQLGKSIPEINAVNVIQNGLTIILAAHNPSQGFAGQIAERVASSPWGTDYCKNIVLVDENVDPFDLSQVMWALSTRVRPEVDIKVIPGVPGMPRNPITQCLGINDKVIIDTTNSK